MRIQKKLAKAVEINEVQTITVDIFDTILLRRVWPEDLQFIEVSKQMTPLLQKNISRKISASEIYSFRVNTRQEYFESNHYTNEDDDLDITLEEWFLSLVDALCLKYSVFLDETVKRSLINQMISLELEIETRHLIVNKNLVRALYSLKHEYKLKIFYLSDMYLNSPQINYLLQYFKIKNLFDGGISSSEVQKAKHSGKLFSHISNHSTEIKVNLFYNLHIGDNYLSDFMMPKMSGSFALHFHQIRFRRIRTKIGYLKLKRYKKSVKRNEQKNLRSGLKLPSSASNILFNWGLLMSQPLLAYLFYILMISREDADTKYIMVSSEAKYFELVGKKAFGSYMNKDNIVVASKLNRRQALRALIWQLYSQKELQSYNIRPIIKTVCYGETNESRNEIYKFILGDNYPFSELALNHRSEAEFIKALKIEIENSAASYKNHLQDAHQYLESVLPSNRNDQVVFLDVGWGGTIQVIVNEFMKLRGYKKEAKGIYIGAHPSSRFLVQQIDSKGYIMNDVLSKKYKQIWNPVLWEYVYTNKPQFSEDEHRLREIQKGVETAIKLFQEERLYPREYFNNVIYDQLARLFISPSSLEAQVIGSTRFDYGFVKKQEIRVCDFKLSRRRFYLNLIKHPKRSIKLMTGSNQWTAGYEAYYRIFFLNIFLKVAKNIKNLKP